MNYIRLNPDSFEEWHNSDTAKLFAPPVTLSYVYQLLAQDFASVMNIREFFADNLGKDLADTVSNALTLDISHRFV